jgi:predicted phosphodiesterase
VVAASKLVRRFAFGGALAPVNVRAVAITGPPEAPAAARVAALYDVHGNLPALEAALDEVARLAVDRIVFGGDLVWGPPDPAGVLTLIHALGNRALPISGNADREVVAAFDGKRSATWSGEPADLNEAMAAWSASRLHSTDREFLASLPGQVVLDIDGLGPVRFVHGSPRSDEEILLPSTPDEVVREALAGVPESVVVGGHTHVSMDRSLDGTRLLNAGSVGLPYEGIPGAYWLLLGPGVELRRTIYDFDAAAALVRECGCPAAAQFADDNVLAAPSREEAIAAFERR